MFALGSVLPTIACCVLQCDASARFDRDETTTLNQIRSEEEEEEEEEDEEDRLLNLRVLLNRNLPQHLRKSNWDLVQDHKLMMRLKTMKM
jgi:hypothetical protein